MPEPNSPPAAPTDPVEPVSNPSQLVGVERDELDALIRAMNTLTDAMRESQENGSTTDPDRLLAEIQNLQADVAMFNHSIQERREQERGFFSVPQLGIHVPRMDPVKSQINRFNGRQPEHLMLAWLIMKRANEKFGGSVITAPSKELTTLVRDMTTGGSGSGAELVAPGTLAQIWQDIFLASLVTGSFPVFPMKYNAQPVPLNVTSATFKKMTESTAPSAQNMTTASATFTVTEVGFYGRISYSLDEDSVIDLVPHILQELRRAGAEAMDNFFLNADSTTGATSNINDIEGTPSSDDYFLSDGEDGLRHMPLVDNTSQAYNVNGAITLAKLTVGISKMGKYASQPSECRMFVDATTYYQGLIGNISQVQTVDVFGRAAAILRGAIDVILGIPVIVPPGLGKAMATGKVSKTAANNTTGQIVVTHRAGWASGFMRDLMIEMDRDIAARDILVVPSFRMAIAGRQRTSATHTVELYNITLS